MSLDCKLVPVIHLLNTLLMAMFNCAKFSWIKAIQIFLVSSNPSVIISVRIQFKFRSTIAWENSQHLATQPQVSPPMMSEKRAQKFHTDDVSLHGSVGRCFWWVVPCGKFSSANQIWVVTRHQYGISALVSQTSFRVETSGGRREMSAFFLG